MLVARLRYEPPLALEPRDEGRIARVLVVHHLQSDRPGVRDPAGGVDRSHRTGARSADRSGIADPARSRREFSRRPSTRPSIRSRNQLHAAARHLSGPPIQRKQPWIHFAFRPPMSSPGAARSGTEGRAAAWQRRQAERDLAQDAARGGRRALAAQVELCRRIGCRAWRVPFPRRRRRRDVDRQLPPSRRAARSRAPGAPDLLAQCALLFASLASGTGTGPSYAGEALAPPSPKGRRGQKDSPRPSRRKERSRNRAGGIRGGG